VSLLRGLAHGAMTVRQQERCWIADARANHAEVDGRVKEIAVPAFPLGKDFLDFVAQ
jgi:hypothetical protein